MTQSSPRFCDDCVVPLTVKHVLAECPSHAQERARNFPELAQVPDALQVLKGILAEKETTQFDPERVLKLLSDVNMLELI